MESDELEMFRVGPCQSSYEMGFLIGRRFSQMIRSRLSRDRIFQDQLLPWALDPQSKPLIESLSNNNRKEFPLYWEELVGTAEGSGVPFLHIMLINFRKEILPFIPEKKRAADAVNDNDIECSDILVVSDSMAFVAHNEDANIALLGHTYLIKATLSNGTTFIAYTCAGELPSCAFGFNNQGMGFTLNAVPPTKDEIVSGGIGRNFISRDLLEATSMDEAITTLRTVETSAGHSYNLIDLKARRICNVETASGHRISIREIGRDPFFHANMYLHLQVNQARDENSIRRLKRADALAKESKDDFLSLLGDSEDAEFPIYMTGPTLYTLCTVTIDLDARTMSVLRGNPCKGEACHVFSLQSSASEQIYTQ
ncbi:hypothetical protein MLD38_038613 [Melastoma candidum]|uniref:Uncharacterized protein n=1 Tax=Melastoma candidum TaxID=119954 RepID=A0ACB9KZP2_9MYRT|nr:hypothetical protein MLD38_038613 [Melastoma candidum]